MDSSSAVLRASRSGLVTVSTSPSRMKARHSATLIRLAMRTLTAMLLTCSPKMRRRRPPSGRVPAPPAQRLGRWWGCARGYEGSSRGWVWVQPVDLVSATIGRTRSPNGGSDQQDYAMTVSADLYDEYKQLSFERGLFPKGPNEFTMTMRLVMWSIC